VAHNTCIEPAESAMQGFILARPHHFKRSLPPQLLKVWQRWTCLTGNETENEIPLDKEKCDLVVRFVLFHDVIQIIIGRNRRKRNSAPHLSASMAARLSAA